MPISRKSLVVKEGENTPRYLSLNCLKLKGEDSLRDHNDKLRCADCPINLAGYCAECCRFIEELSFKLGITLVDRDILVKDKNWTELDPDVRSDLFDKILNDGIVKDGRVSFNGLSKFSTWAFGIFKYQKRELFKLAKYEHENVVDDVNITSEDGNIKPWDEVVSKRYNNINKVEGDYIPDDIMTKEIRRVILLCHERIYKQDKRCGELMIAFCNQSLQGMEEDETYTFTSSDELNKTPVYNALAVRFGATIEMVRGWLRSCNDKHLPRLRRCLQEQGYGLEFVVG
jgi:hypothetical protein